MLVWINGEAKICKSKSCETERGDAIEVCESE